MLKHERASAQLCAKTARIRCGLRRDAACAGERACLHATATARDMPARCDSVADWDPTDEEIQRKPPSYSAHKHWSMPRRDGHVRLSTEEDEADATEGGHPGLRRPGSAACGVNLLRWRTAMLAVAFTPWLLVLALLVEHQFAPAAHSDEQVRARVGVVLLQDTPILKHRVPLPVEPNLLAHILLLGLAHFSKGLLVHHDSRRATACAHASTSPDT